MPIALAQAIGPHAGAATIASAVEAAIAESRLAPAEKLPTVRELAANLGVSPATVAAAYRTLRQRGFVVTGRGRGTQVAAVPPVRVRRAAELPPGVRDLSRGNPEPALLPPLGDALARIETTHKLYGDAPKLPELASLAAAEFTADGVHGEVAITNGALDAIERALQTELRVGDVVVVEDPVWPRIPDLVHALGLAIEPVPVDRRGLDPEALEQALRAGARAVIATPRGQNPTGASIDRARARELRATLERYPDVLLIEDDYVARAAGAPYVPIHRPAGRWLVVRTLSKVLGPDLRVALVAGDALTVSRLEGRQALGPGWVSHILQRLAAFLLEDASTLHLLARAERAYAGRRRALVEALAARGIDSTGDSGLSVWVPLADEAAAVRELLLQGWAVSPGERYRFRTAPGIRITTADLEPAEAEKLADAIAALRDGGPRVYSG
ncbi:MAG TPA: aminotransferase class I/II-fold pyridoxal phosphate-dependent enzyme [Gaiellaceae bacterium]|nr:aminotransferase class I/II-fold pyridoxal phosphate-dependent enzyme [Gaiellaceae bacterium]